MYLEERLLSGQSLSQCANEDYKGYKVKETIYNFRLLETLKPMKSKKSVKSIRKEGVLESLKSSLLRVGRRPYRVGRCI